MFHCVWVFRGSVHVRRRVDQLIIALCAKRKLRCCRQCCGSGMFIPDLGSRIRTVSIPDPGSSSKNLSILTPPKAKKWFLSSKKYDPGCSSRIPDPDADFLPSRIPDPGVKKVPNPGSLLIKYPNCNDRSSSASIFYAYRTSHQCFGSGSRQAKFSPKKGKKWNNFMFEEFSVGLEASPGAWMYFVVDKKTYDGFWSKKFCCHLKKL